MSTEPLDQDARVARMFRGLDEAPKHTGLSLRGLGPEAPPQHRGLTVVSTWLVPTSTDPLVATRNGEVNRLFAITGDAAADLRPFSRYPQEREVVYLPGTVFVMGPTELVEDVAVTFVDQADPQRDPRLAAHFLLDNVRSAVRELLATSRRRAPVRVPHPEKFIGPLG